MLKNEVGLVVRMALKEQTSQLLGILASTSIIGVGFAVGGPIGTTVMAAIGVNLSSSIIQNGSIKLKERWLSGDNGILNHDIQQALARAFIKALAQLEAKFFELGETNALAENEQESIRALFKEMRGQAQQRFVASLQQSLKEQDIKDYLYTTPEKATDMLWKRIDGARLLSTYNEHFKDFLRRNLLSELQFWFGEELKTDNKESNRAWRAFQRLLLEGIQADVKAVQASQDLIYRDLQKLDALSSQLAQLRDAIDHRLPNEPFQQDLERAIVRTPSSPKYLFLSGCSVGNYVAITPFPGSGNQDIIALNEFIAALRHIGIRDKAVIDPIVEARDRLTSPTPHALDNEIVKTIIERFLAAISRVPATLQAQSSSEEFQWFRFGQLLYEIPTSVMLKSGQTHALVIALESLMEQISLPSSLYKEVAEFILATKSRKDAEALLENANQVAQATFLAI